MRKAIHYPIWAILALALLACNTPNKQQPVSDDAVPTLKEALAGKFYIGTALNEDQITGADTLGLALLTKHFNAITAENCMKSETIHPGVDRYDFDLPDQFVALGESNDMHIVGHTLIWHSQAPDWFFVDDQGREVAPEVLKERMKEHITTVVGRYKGRIHGWDVVNEALLEDGSYRPSPFYRILGEAFIPLAFQYAHQADPEAELYYNDYNEWHPGKREAIVRLIRDLKSQGIRIDGIGMQGHIGMDYPSLDEYQAAIKAYADEGMKVMITELDMSILPAPNWDGGADIATDIAYQQELNPYTDGLPDSVAAAWNQRMAAFFDLFRRNADAITRVTTWGIADQDSWKNDFPVRGRTDYPLLFDRNHQLKPVFEELRIRN